MRHPKADPVRMELTAETLRELLDYDPLTGLFTWRRSSLRPVFWNTRYGGTQAGSVRAPSNKDRAYSRRTIDIKVGGKKRHYYASILAWLWMTGEWPKFTVDHENADSTDDRWDNLREATPSQNNYNQRLRPDNKAGFKGVSLHSQNGTYVAEVKAGAIRLRLNGFSTPEEAAAARAAIAAKLHGEFARTA